jgi:hypothetical protein
MSKKRVCMDERTYKDEHRNLINVLKKGTKKEREEEARKQRKEVNERKRGK